MDERAPAKVNLYLHITGRRPDGYHELDSLAVFPGVGDHLRAEPADAVSLRVEGPFGPGLDAGPDNLALRAARALAAASGVEAGAALILDKRLPVASGIGGGSADAAAALRLLSRLWGLALPPAALAGLAAELGADVPVCLLSQPSRMGGTGEILGIAPLLPPCGIALANPGVAVSTEAVFRARDAGHGPGYSAAADLPPRWPDAAAMAGDLARLGNDLEAPAVAMRPEIGAALDWLRARPGCLLARMSGSGATCFGLFADGPAAERAASGPPPGWWTWGGAAAH